MTKEMKYTPGPYSYDEQACSVRSKSKLVATVFPCRAPDRTTGKFQWNNQKEKEENAANLRLFAAAPDMLKALEKSIELSDEIKATEGKKLTATAKMDLLIRHDQNEKMMKAIIEKMK